MTRFDQITLDELINHLPQGADGVTSSRIKEAYTFLETLHGDRLRDSGERYVEHDLVLAQFMLDLDVDTETLIACLLHDSLLPHTGIKVEDIERNFGPAIASIVSGLNNLQAYASQTKLKTRTNGDIDIVSSVALSSSGTLNSIGILPPCVVFKWSLTTGVQRTRAALARVGVRLERLVRHFMQW